MLFNLFPQIIIILSIAAAFYVVMRKNGQIKNQEEILIKIKREILTKIKREILTKIRRKNSVKIKKYWDSAKLRIKTIGNRNPSDTHNNNNAVAKMIAEQKYIDVISQDPQNVEAYTKLGNLYQEQGNTEDAAACFKQAEKLKKIG